MNFPYLLNPIVLSALFLTALNDHVLKVTYPNFWTGKISDFTGLFYFPLFFYALVSFIQNPRGEHSKIDLRKLIILIVLTDFLFVVCKFTFLKNILIKVFPLSIVSDWTDLAALTVNFAIYFFARRYSVNSNGPN